MENYQFKDAARSNQRKAWWIAVTIHLMVIAGVMGASSDSINWQEYMPETVKEWLKMENPKTEAQDLKKPQAMAKP